MVDIIIPLTFFLLLIGVAGLAFWIWMIIDCATKEAAESDAESA